MRKMFLLSLTLSVLAIALSECKSSKATGGASLTPPYVPTESIATAHAVTMKDLNGGRAVFIAKCDQCHKLPSVDKHDAGGWQVTLSRMAPKAKLTSLESEQLLKYLASAK